MRERNTAQRMRAGLADRTGWYRFLWTRGCAGSQLPQAAF